MKSIDPKESTVVQTRELPMTALYAVKDHVAALRALVSWNRVGVLMDEGPQAIVTVLLDGETVVVRTVGIKVESLHEYDPETGTVLGGPHDNDNDDDDLEE